MGRRKHLGELEQMVLLAALQLGREAYTAGVREELGSRAARRISRSALYQVLERLGEKGYLEWDFDEVRIPERGGHPMRRIVVTAAGRRELKASRQALFNLWDGIEQQLEEA